MKESMGWIEEVIHSSIGILEKASLNKKLLGGTLAGGREGVFILEASLNEEVGKFLRSLPFWFAMKWSIVPLQSFHSAVEQDKEMFKRAREMMGEK